MLAVSLAVTPVPDGKNILVNGIPGEGEWSESGCINLDNETELRFHKDDGNFYLGIIFLGPHHSGIDLYIDSGGVVRMIHVSSALGEKVLENGDWSDYTWGRNSWWTANQIGSIWEDGKTRFLEPQCFEFQLDRHGLGTDIRLYIHLKRPEKSFPEGASPETRDGWIGLSLE
jgi:hypothetical protein